MNKRQIFLIVPILLLASCQREMDVPDQFKAPDITAEIQAETRTVLSVDEYGAGTIYWKTADQIDVFIGENKLVYTSQNSSNAATATFKTNDGLGGNYPDSEPILAIYPSYEESYINEWGDRLVCSYLPSQQYGLPGTFDDDLFMAVATGTKQNMGSSTPLSFHNICSGLKFSLSRDDITCVKFRGTDTSYGDPVVLAGDVFFEFDGAWSGSSSGATEITLYPKSGGTFQKDAYYYIICFPASLRDFYVDFETTSGASATLRGIEYNQARGVLIDEPFEFRTSIFMKKTHIDEYAKFSDEDVPHTQIKYWTSGTPDSIWQNAPEGGYYEWFGVEPFQNESVYDQSAGIGYGEFFFNSPVTRIGPSLFKNSNLTQIYLPMSITEIGNSAFEGSSSLTYLSVPQSLISIGSRAFYGCSSLESRSLSIPDSVTSIGSQAYENCLNLTSLEIPSSVTDIGVEAFGGCVGLASIIVDSSNPVFDSRENCNAIIRTDTNELVSGCKNTVIPNSVTKIGACAFYGGSGLASIEIPSSVSHIGISAFTYCTGLTSITVYADTPPQLDNHLVFSGTNNCPIYVPAGSVAAYKSAWSEYADRIRPNVEAVDLGLPSGLKWATCNVGADTPEEYGDYFAWGETSPKSEYDWTTYGWCDGSYSTLSKYNTKSGFGTIDNKTVLDLSDDAAHVNWGGSWRMPTDAELTELRENCTWTWTTQGGKNGYRVSSNSNGNSIFLPAAGMIYSTSYRMIGTNGRYWSSSLYTDGPLDSYEDSDRPQALPFSSDQVLGYHYFRMYGLSVRPVYGEFIPVTSVSMNTSNLTLTKGNSDVLSATVSPSNATEPRVRWISSNTSVAAVSSEGVVTAVSAGTAIITAWASDGEHSATCTVTVTTPYHAVDMGLSVQWASCNVGASSPEDYGDYFAWGETEPKSGYYEWASYSLCSGTYNTLTKYNLVESYGVVDNKTILEPSDDAAYVNWGEGWRMPTQSEISELGQCHWVWTTQGGKKGYRVTSSVNGNSIFLPAAGVRNDITPYDIGSIGSYWSRTNDLKNPYDAYRMDFDSSSRGRSAFYRAYGMPIRPVYGAFIPVESVSLNHASLELQVGQTSTLSATVLPASASEKAVTWTSDNTDVATVTFYGLVTAISLGSATITARTNDGLKVATCVVTVDHEWVDLGLPSGLKWATYNVGASSPEEYGDYFAWGEIMPKSSYSWTNYKYRASGSTDDNVTFSKYNTKSGRGTIDNKTRLDFSDDAARSIWGGDWRMPTSAEMSELKSNCDVTWTTQNGVNGCLLTSKINGKSVFFPAAGYKTGNMVDVGTSVLIRTSSLISDHPFMAQIFYYKPSSNSSPSSSYRIADMHYIVYSDYNTRYPGLSIRAVK